MPSASSASVVCSLGRPLPIQRHTARPSHTVQAAHSGGRACGAWPARGSARSTARRFFGASVVKRTHNPAEWRLRDHTTWASSSARAGSRS
jgi:hypothetical protein